MVSSTKQRWGRMTFFQRYWKRILKPIAVSIDAPFQDVVANCEEHLENGVIDLPCVWIINKCWLISIRIADFFHISLVVERSRSWNSYLYIYSLDCVLPYIAGTGITIMVDHYTSFCKKWQNYALVPLLNLKEGYLSYGEPIPFGPEFSWPLYWTNTDG